MIPGPLKLTKGPTRRSSLWTRPSWPLKGRQLILWPPSRGKADRLRIPILIDPEGTVIGRPPSTLLAAGKFLFLTCQAAAAPLSATVPHDSGGPKLCFPILSKSSPCTLLRGTRVASCGQGPNWFHQGSEKKSLMSKFRKKELRRAAVVRA